MKVISPDSAPLRAALRHAPGLPQFDSTQIQSHAADEHLCVLGEDAAVHAHCSLWWNHTPPFSTHKVGAIGHYGAADDQSAATLLDEALTRLRARQCTIAVGPMDGNTWRHYRFVTQSGAGQTPEPSFFLEPQNPPQWPAQFEGAGFRRLAEYYSALNTDLARTDERIEPVAARLERSGVRIRSAAKAELARELIRIYQVSRIAFTGNFLYTELPQPAFVAQYTRLLDRLEPELVLLAERGQDLVGYLFAIPDFAQAARGSAIDTFLIKTVAILPDAALGGLGRVLVARAQQAGHRLGFQRCIHALMHEDNVSRNISRHYGITMRRYALYCREIAG